jgi:exoribonuclease-2
MLPDEVVQAYTLTEGRDCPALSLYVTVDERTLELRGQETRIERVPIVANLRHDRLDAVITTDALEGHAPAGFAFAAELAFAYRLAVQLKARREVVRGRPESFSRPDYTFRLEGGNGAAPSGNERVVITPRQRGTPLDLIVAEAMILANSTWGGWLASNAVPGIYRSQASLAPGIKVRMGTKPAPHAGMGVPQYTWATSPLRRYVDLVNQWQIIACVRHGRTAALAAPFRAKDSALLAIVSNFDGAYTAYNEFQRTIERFWTLMWLEQNRVREFEVDMIRDGLARAEQLPLVVSVPGAETLPRGTRVRVRVAGLDLLTLDVHVQLIERLVGAAAPGTEEADEEIEAQGPLELAIDVQDATPEEAAPPALG